MGVILKRLYIHNFKSFWHSKFKFGKLNCLIAPNNAGKSNLVEALELLDNILKKDLSKVFTLKENGKNFRYKEDEIKLKATFFSDNMALIDSSLMEYKIETTVDIRLNLKNLDFSIETTNQGKIKAILVDSIDIHRDNFIIRKYNEDIELILDNYKEYIELLDKTDFIKLDGVEKSDELFTVLSGFDEINNKNFSDVIQNILGTKQLLSSFYFHPEVIKYKQQYETNFLMKDGTNLAYFLNTLDKDSFENISTSLIGELELIESIEISNGAIPHIVFNENVDGKIDKMTYQKVSDGTIHFLALMTALYASKGELLVFEEPERHMHRKVLSYIIDTMRGSDKQIFFTTHSTEILQLLELDEIVFLYRDYSGNTQSKRADDMYNIEKLMEIYDNDFVEMLKSGTFDDLNLEEES